MKRYFSIVLVLSMLLSMVSFASAEEKAKEVIAVEDEIVTVENNEEFASLLLLKNEFDPSINTFAKKYAGLTIEFDCNIAFMGPHGDYTTRYDILILAGDYSEDSASGPYFQFVDVNISDLNLTGDNIPDYIGTGDNLHILAIVESFNENSGLFLLKPIETVVR